nr:DNA helicase [Tanacetum cinerariifolium]
MELMELCTKLFDRVLDLEKTKTTQAKEIADLKKRVKKLERKRRSRTSRMNLFNIGTSRRRSLGKDDASKQGRNLKQRGGLLGLKDFLVMLKLLLQVMVSTAGIKPYTWLRSSRSIQIEIYKHVVQILSIHLQNIQRVVFRDKDKLDDVVVNTRTKKTTLTEWLRYNEQNTDGRHLTYLNFPNEFVWNLNGKYWSRRCQRHKSSIGGLIYVHPIAGKTFLWKTITYTLRANRKIVLTVASSGVASLLLPVGRTSHSRFKLPLDLTDTSVCSVKKTQLANLIRETSLIIWDEASMNDRRCFETLDKTLRDILRKSYALFGGKTIMLGGDFRETLPVKKGASRNKIIASSIAKSYLWHHFMLHRLTKNMHLADENMDETQKDRVSTFAKLLLDIKDGSIGIPDECDPENTSWVNIPEIY